MRKVLRALSMFCCFAVLLLARLPAQQRSAASATGYRIAGKVVDAHTGAALARSSVQIADVKSRTNPQTVISADDGSFAFDGLSRGKYSLSAEHRGYMAQSYEEHEQFSTAIAVGPGLDSENLIFKLTAEGIIAGTVTDEAGEPVRGAQVRLFADEDATGIRSTRVRHTVVTDDRGVYEITGLRPGAYFVVVTARPWYAQRLQRMNAGNGEDQSSEMQTLDTAYPTTYYPGVTDEDSATPIPIKGGDRLEANLTLAAQPALRLRLNLPEGNSGVSVALSQSIFGQSENQATQINYLGKGAVEVDGILPGHYDVTLNGQFEGAREPRHFSTDIAGGATELSEENSVGEITVTGKVISSTGKLPPEAGISLHTPNQRRQRYSALNDAGEFSIQVAPGTYEVVGNINGMYIAGLKATGASLAGRMLTVKAGDSPKLEVVTGTGHGEVEGTARRGDKPASAVMVLLAPEDPKNNQILFRRDQSDSDGTFSLSDIIPGRYRLLAIANGWELEWANPAVLQAFLAKSVLIEVKSGDHLNQSIQVQDR